jgi:diguanylate cyclase (GGDEF)-like protein
MSSLSPDWENRRLAILQMIASMQPMNEILAAIAETLMLTASPGGSAVLRVKDLKLRVAAAAGFSNREIETLSSLSTSLLDGSRFHLGNRQGEFRLRAILSGAGEVLGALLLRLPGLADGDPEDPAGRPEIDPRFENLEAFTALALEQNHLLEELSYRSEHDALTDVFDRLAVERVLAKALAAACPGSSIHSRKVALIVIGIDRQRRINAALGHNVGNQLLREAARRLSLNCGDQAILGRAGGDEFLILMPELTAVEEAAVLARRLLALTRLPFVIGDHELSITAAAGISVSSPEAFRPEHLEARAYAALEYAKSLGGNQCCFFDSSMATVSPGYLELETHLRGALAGRELQLYYQPQLALAGFSTVAVEALLRWQHPELGLVSPCSFIPMAEEGGLIGEIGEWALEEGLRQLADWQRSGIQNLRLGVNVSPLQFRRRDFARRVLEILERAGFDGRDLVLEITEGTIIQDLDFAVAQMNRLRDAGIRFAIDDFGTGYSSLSYLQRLPAFQLKIDRSFVGEIRYPGQRPPLLAGILRLANELGVSTLAEGIETLDQANALQSMGCQEGQGFLFSKPLPANELGAWYRKAHGQREVPNALRYLPNCTRSVL